MPAIVVDSLIATGCVVAATVAAVINSGRHCHAYWIDRQEADRLAARNRHPAGRRLDRAGQDWADADARSKNGRSTYY